MSSDKRGLAGFSDRPEVEAARLAAQLEEAGLKVERFINVQDGTKKSTNHTRSGPESIDGNYGIYAGDGLVDIDVDNYTADGGVAVDLDALNDLPDTLTVETPHTDGVTGGHRFYKIVPGDEFETAAEACESVWDGTTNPSQSWGEIRVQNQYVVGPGSQLDDCDKQWCSACVDPEGGYYTIADDVPIATITADDLANVIRADPKYDPANENHESHTDETADASSSVGSVDSTAWESRLEFDPDAAAVMHQAVREFQNDMETTPQAFRNVMGLIRGNYAEWGHEGDRSGAEVDLASFLYGILRFTGDDENAMQRIYSYISEACRDQQLTDRGERRKWLDSGEEYRHGTIDSAVGIFDQKWWDQWRLSKEDPYQHTGEYGDPIYRYVLRAVQVAYEERPGYPSKDDVLDVVQGFNPERARTSHEEVLKRLQRERGQVKVARCGRTTWVYYPASESDPPNASYVLCGGERYEPD